MTAMQLAQFASRCEICLQRHIKEGDLIDKTARGWAAEECIAAQERLEGVEERVRRAMQEHGYAFGIALPDSGLETVGTIGDFYRKARDLGLVSGNEYRDLQRVHSGVWIRSLTD
jgi:hypothetical protein